MRVWRKHNEHSVHMLASSLLSRASIADAHPRWVVLCGRAGMERRRSEDVAGHGRAGKTAFGERPQSLENQRTLSFL